jgi:hypothetical protein
MATMMEILVLNLSNTTNQVRYMWRSDLSLTWTLFQFFVLRLKIFNSDLKVWPHSTLTMN